MRIGLNGRLDTLQAAVVLEKLKIFDDEVALRQQAAQRYTQSLPKGVVVPRVPEGLQSVWAQYSILTSQREALMTLLKSQDIPTVVYYPNPLHLQKAFADLQYAPDSCPVAEKTAHQILSLPLHPYLTESEQKKILTAIQRFGH